MDFWQTVLVLVRRWYVAVPAFIATVGLAAAAYSTVPLQYQSDSILVLTTPLSGATTAPTAHQPKVVTNPLLNFDQSLALTASIVIQQMNSLETAQALGMTPGNTSSYQVSNGSTNPELLESGPFIFIQGTAATAAEAQDITRRASAMATDVLKERQQELNAPTSTHILMQVVVAPTTGQPQTSSPMRKAAAAGALGGLMTLVAVFGFDSMAASRTLRRKRTSAADRVAAPDESRRPPENAPDPRPRRWQRSRRPSTTGPSPRAPRVPVLEEP